MACHALAACLAKLLWKVELVWHAKVAGVPRLSLQVARHSEILGLACHAFDIKWNTQPLLLLGVPRLDPQVARPSDFLELACNAFDTKWHAIVKVVPGVVSWCATPFGSSGTPIVADGLGVPRPTWRATPLQCPP
ncbi:hypothetical protein AHAS_Ahas14G0148800 [Arachis hypogaea]